MKNRNSHAVKVLGTCCVALLLIRLVFLVRGPGVAGDAVLHFGVPARMVAEEAARLAGRGGRVLLVTGPEAGRTAKVREEAFTEGLKDGGALLAGVLRANPGEVDPVGGWTGDFRRRMESAYPAVDVVVSFAQLPGLRSGEGALSGQWIAVLPYEPLMDELFRVGRLTAAVVPRPDSPAAGALEKNGERWFASQYKWVRLEDWQAGRGLETGGQIPADPGYSERVDIFNR